MRRFKRIGLIVVAILFVVGVVRYLTAPKPGTVRYHLEQLGIWTKMTLAEPDSFRGYFRWATWSWYLHGKPDAYVWMAKLVEHEQALIRLDHFEHHEFELQNRLMDEQFWHECNLEIRNSTPNCAPWTIDYGKWGASVIGVTTARTNITKLEELIKRLDKPSGR